MNDFMNTSSKTEPFDVPGATMTGIVLSEPEKMVQREEDGSAKTFRSGDERMMYKIMLQTDLRDTADPYDTGIRAFYAKWQSQKAIADAVRAAGRPAVEIGAQLTIIMTGFGPRGNKPQPPKLWAARYVPPAPAFMTETAPQPQYPQQPHYPQAQQPQYPPQPQYPQAQPQQQYAQPQYPPQQPQYAAPVPPQPAPVPMPQPMTTEQQAAAARALLEQQLAAKAVQPSEPPF